MNNKNKNKGITLMETIVSVSLLVLVSSVILFSFNSLNNKQTLEKEVDFIKSTINQARLNRINSKENAPASIIITYDSIIYGGRITKLGKDIYLLNLSYFNAGSNAALIIDFDKLSGFSNSEYNIIYGLKKGNKIVATSSFKINKLGIIE